MIYLEQNGVTVRGMRESDIAALSEGFAAQGWSKQPEQFARYLSEQESGARRVLVAEWQGQAAGYVTLLPDSPGGPFAGTGLPEIVDFNVLIKFQRHGIGSCLLDAAEALAGRESDTVVLGVGLHPGYGSAQRMYVKRGYLPDGSGIWYRDRLLKQGESCCNDDDLVLYLSKKLRP